jgi:hypothetical protein
MDIKQLAEKYELKRDDFWEHKQSGSWIIKHDAIEKIMYIEKIEVLDMQVLNSERDFVRFLITMKKGDRTVTTVGEADKSNCTSRHYGCMAEKRGIGRGTLKLVRAYNYGVYSEVEADDFKKPVEYTSKAYKPSNKASDYMKNNMRKIFSAKGAYKKDKAEAIFRELTKEDGQRIKDLMEGGKIEQAVEQFYKL